MNASTYQIMRDIRKLSKEDRLRLMGCIVESLLNSSPESSQHPLKYCESLDAYLSPEEEAKLKEN